jgi:hypothetical protein
VPQQRNPHEVYIEANYGDVVSNQRALAWANGRMIQLRADGAPDNYDTLARAMNETRKQFRIAGHDKRSAPTDAERRRYTGIASGPRAGSSDGGSPKQGLTEAQMKIARAFYPKMPEKLAYATWYKKVGRRLEG